MNDQYPFNVPLIFIRTAWMTNYRGLVGDDELAIGGGGYVVEHGYGEEIFNFQTFQGRVYGGCRPPGTKGTTDGRINLKNLGGKSGDEFVSGVTVVWVAVNEKAQAKIVGWYKNAMVFAKWQPPPIGSDRRIEDMDCGFYVTTQEEEAQLIPKHRRSFDVPRGGEGEFGQSNVWYAKGADWHREYRHSVLKLVTTFKQS